MRWNRRPKRSKTQNIVWDWVRSWSVTRERLKKVSVSSKERHIVTTKNDSSAALDIKYRLRVRA